jgi:hypothetical protein
MYRQLYQMGGSPVGIATMPMDYGQSLQVNNQGQGQTPLMSQAPNYSSAVNITANPLLNYGQPQLNQAGGTPLTMRSGGRIGYQEGGMGMVQDQTQPQQMDARQALELIIQMLIAQGIPPEQAREIAIQMVQAVAEGGMEEMSDERVEARFGGRIGYASGGIGSLVDRQGYFVGKIAKAVTGAVKGVANAVKSVVKSPIGKLALTAAALYAAPYAFGATTGGLTGYAQAFPGLAPTIASGQEFFLGPITEGGTRGIGFLDKINPFSSGFNLLNAAKDVGISSLIPSKGTLLSSAIGGVFGGALGGEPVRENYGSDEEFEQAVAQWKLTLNQGLSSPQLSITNAPLNLYPNNPFYAQRRANGGRIGYQAGGIGDLISQVTKQEYFGKPMLAEGGIPLGEPRQNQAGITELDYRQTGGFVPPIGIKERADDIPAMLSNNEFVFTADAVRNAGGGDENLGAKRMYKLMKQLESGGSV